MQQLDHRSLAYRIDLLLRTRQLESRACPSGANSERAAAAVRPLVSHAIALDLSERGSTLTTGDLLALREGRRTEVDEADLVRLADECGLPAWTLTTTPPRGTA